MTRYLLGVALLMTLFHVNASFTEAAATEPLSPGVKYQSDIQYAEVDNIKLLLDLYVPTKDSQNSEQREKPPLVLYVHGGGWRTGSHHAPAFSVWLANRGYAVASISYRSSDQARFPAQIHDCKGAVRWLRAHADQYGYDASRIAAMGSSAGGHLVLLLGVTAGNRELEGDVGGNLDQSSAVQCVIDFYGPSDFILRSKDQPQTTEYPDGNVHRLLGKPVTGNEDWAKLASPAWHMTKDAPPLIIFHGDKDRTVLLNQSYRIRDLYQSLGRPVALHVIAGGEHGGPKFHTPAVHEQVAQFLNTYFRVPVPTPAP